MSTGKSNERMVEIKSDMLKYVLGRDRSNLKNLQNKYSTLRIYSVRGQKKGIMIEGEAINQIDSCIRDINDYYKMTNLFLNEIDLVVSVKESKANPYFTLFEENDDGFLIKSKEGNYTRRQDCPKTFCYNGSIYLIKIESLVKYGLHGIKKIKKFLMPLERSIDIDSIYDWKMAELIINNSFENS